MLIPSVRSAAERDRLKVVAEVGYDRAAGGGAGDEVELTTDLHPALSSGQILVLVSEYVVSSASRDSQQDADRDARERGQAMGADSGPGRG